MIPNSSLIAPQNMAFIIISTLYKQLITSKPKHGTIFCVRKGGRYGRYYCTCSLFVVKERNINTSSNHCC